MPIFSKTLRESDLNNPMQAIKAMANHIRYIQEQLEYTLLTLDSTNINEIDIDVTALQASTGAVDLNGSKFAFKGANGEEFEVGQEEGKAFQCKLNGRGGANIFYLDDKGKFIITNNATLDIDGGEW